MGTELGSSPLAEQFGCGPACPSYASGSSGEFLLRIGAFNKFNYCNAVLEINVDGDVSGCGAGINDVYCCPGRVRCI